MRDSTMTARGGNSGSGAEAAARLREAAEAILLADGWPGFNTNAVAARAGVNISVLYRHYPDKYAILGQIVRDAHDQAVESVTPLLVAFPTAPDLTDWVRSTFDALLRLRVDQPVGKVARDTSLALPELSGIEDEISQRFVTGFAPLIAQRFPEAPPDRVRQVARVLWVVSTHAADFLAGSDEPSAPFVDELVVMVSALFASLAASTTR